VKRQFDKTGKLWELTAKLILESLFQSGALSSVHVLVTKEAEKMLATAGSKLLRTEYKCDRVVRKDRKTDRNQLQSKVRRFFNPVAV